MSRIARLATAGAVAASLVGTASAQAADTVAPSITSMTPNNVYLKGTVTVNATAADAGSPKSGVQSYGCLDNNNFVLFNTVTPNNGGQYPNTFSWSFPISGEGQHKVGCAANDAAGNNGAPTYVTFRIDNTAPVTSAAVTNQTTTSATVQVSATDPNLNGGALAGSGVASISTKVDGGATTTSANNPRTFTFNTQGVHTIEYWSTDNVGNVSAHKTITVVLDNVKPDVSYRGASSRTIARGSGGDSDDPRSGYLIGDATDNRGVTKVQVRFVSAGDSDLGFNQTYTATCNSCGPTSQSVIWYLDLAQLSPAPPTGIYTTQITAFDQAGNKRTIAGPTVTFQP